jgi:thymidylate kinase
LSDRYWDASRAYQGVARNLGIRNVDMINNFATEGLQADHVFLLDLDDDLNKKQILVTTISELPDSYLPSKNSFFKEEHYHAYTLELKNQFDKKTSEQNLFDELLKKVNILEEQQRETYDLLYKVFFVWYKQKSTTSVYQDDLLNSLTNNQSSNYAKLKSWQ